MFYNMEAARCSTAAEATPMAGSHPAPEARFGLPDPDTPQDFVEKILTSKSALEGERNRVPGRFAVLKGSTDRQAASPWLTSPRPSWTCPGCAPECP